MTIPRVAGIDLDFASLAEQQCCLACEMSCSDAGSDRAHADAIAGAVRQAAEHVTETLRAEIAGVLATIDAAETRLTWPMLAVGGLVVAALRLFG